MLETLRIFKQFRFPVGRPVTAIASLGLVGAAAESVALVLIVGMLQRVLSASQETELEIGLDLTIGTNAGALVALAMIIIAVATQLAAARITVRLSTTFLAHIRSNLLTTFSNATHLVQEAHAAGRLQEYATSLPYQASLMPMRFATMVASAVAIGVLMLTAFYVDAVVALVILVVGGALTISLRPLGKRVGDRTQRYVSTQGTFAEHVAKWSSQARDIQAFGVERGAYEEIGGQIASTSDALSTLRFWMDANVIAYRATALVLLLGLGLAARHFGVDDPARATVVMALLLRAFSFAQQLNSAQQVVRESQGPAREVSREILTLKSHRETPGVCDMESVRSLSMMSVTFAYPDQSDAAVRAVDLELRPGDRLGIVGASGAGKTTLINLLLGLYRPSTGSVLLNGSDLAELSDSSRSRLIGFSAQSSVLSSGPSFEAIRFFRPHVEAAQINDQISQLFGTDEGGVGQRDLGGLGGGMSGGRQQRLALIRAICSGPGLVVLDEPTSALDDVNELRVVELLRTLPSDTIVIVATHRPLPLSICNRFVSLHNGQLVPRQSAESALNAAEEHPR